MLLLGLYHFFGLIVAHQFGDCISLLDHTKVQVRALSNVPKATLVTIERSTEDDWEVRILHEEMKFPLWLNGRTTITFHAASTFPKKSVSPCCFKILKDKAAERNGLDVLNRYKLCDKKNMFLTTGTSTYVVVADWPP
ncbi:unnamed protein product [Malus baccata var. baccata]